MRLTVLILSFILLTPYLMAKEAYTSDSLLIELKEKASKLEKNSKEYKKLIRIYLRKLSGLKSKHLNTYQFDKAKRVKAVIASVKKGDFNVEAPKEKVVKKKEKKIVVASFIKEYFSEGLMDKDGKPIRLSQLSGKTIGIYFSAHWCGPCRSFTPKLVKFRDANKKDFEVVFVSSDRSEQKKSEYMTEAGMKWPAAKLKGDNSNALSTKFSVSGIPTLVIISSTGTLITKSGRGDVMSNPDTAIKTWQRTK